MRISLNFTPKLAAALIATLATTAAEAAPVHVRGTVQSVEGADVQVATVEGKTVRLTLGQGWTVGGVVAATRADIKPGTFIGTANQPDGQGASALEVVVFPEALRGTGEGDRDWDLKPNSRMTNAAVANRVEGVNGPVLTLKYKGGEKTVTIPEGTPIVAITAATAADVKPGAHVFVAGEADPDGTKLGGGRIVVGLNGATPPM